MTSKRQGLARFLSFVIAGIAVGFVASRILPIAVWLTLGESSVNALAMLFRPGSFISLAVIGGFVGLWIGYRKVPDVGRMAYPLAVVLVLAFPAWQYAQTRFVRATPKAVAEAVLSGSAGSTALALSRPEERGHDRHFTVMYSDTAVGYVLVRPFLGLLWKSGGSSISLPDKQ